MENVKLTPLYLDKDTEERLLPSQAMSEAINVRTMSGKKGERQILRNLRSTENMIVNPTFAMRQQGETEFDWSEHGDVSAVGHAVNIDRSELFVIYYSSTGKHTILRYSTYDDVWECVMISELLNLQKTSYVSADAVTFDDGTLLYLTDNTQNPLKININLCIAATNNNDFGSANTNLFTDLFEFNHFFRVTKFPPINKPTVEVFTDRDKSYNNIVNGAYQFAFNYVYTDFEESTYSPFSELAVSTQSLNQVVANSLQPIAESNGIRVKGSYAKGDVKEINIVARDRNDGDWFLVETIDNEPNSGEWEFEFFNDGLYTLIDQSEITNPFHAVPKRARALRINNNRLFFGNYVEGFDNVDGGDLDLRIGINYQERQDVEEETLEASTPFKKFATSRTPPASERADDPILTVNCDVDVNIGDVMVISLDFKNILVNGNSSSPFNQRETFRYEFPVLVTQMRVNEETSVTPLSIQIANHLNSALQTTRVSAYNAGRNSSSTSRNSFSFDFLGVIEITTSAGFTQLLFKRKQFIASTAGLTPDTSSANIQGSFSSNGEFRAISSILRFSQGAYIEQGSNIDHIENSEDGEFVTPSFRIIEQNVSGSLTSFKRGAFHEFGILYQDDAARNGGVVRDDRLRKEVKWYSETERKGAVSMDWTIGGTPPSWATHYKWVYSGNQTVDDFLQFKVIDVHRAKKGFSANGATDDTVVVQSDNRIYINLRGLEGKPDSYKESFGSILSYNFTEGDRIRIKSFINPDNGLRVFPDRPLDFKVLGKEFFNPTEDGNPLYSENLSDFEKYNTSGWFLIVENPQVDGWDYDSINNEGKNLWVNKNTSIDPEDGDYINDGAVVEVYTPKKTSEQVVYTEITDAIPIIDGNHGGELRNEGEDVIQSYSLGGVFGITIPNILRVDDSSKFIVGDSVAVTTPSTITFAKIVSVFSGGVIIDQPAPTAPSEGTITLITKTAVGRFQGGDVWYKPRLLRRNNEKNTFDFTVDYVEDYKHSDFINNQSTYKGRQQFFIKNERERRRRASMIHSESLLQEDNANGLSSFNLQNNIFYDYNIQGGGIQYIANMGDDIVVYQESKSFRVAVSKNIIESAEGGQSITLSRNILSDARYYKGEYGIGVHPETFQDDDGTHFFFDLKRGKVMRLGGDGLFAVSDIDNKSTFNQIANTYLNSYRTIKLIGGLDRENREYSLTLPQIDLRSIIIDGIDTELNINATEDVDNIYVSNLQSLYTPQSPRITMGSETRTFAEVCEVWGDWGSPVEFLDYISKEGAVRLPQSLVPQAVQDIFGNVTFINTQTNILIKLGGDYLQATYDITGGVLTIPKDQSCSAQMLELSQSSLLNEANTITFNIDEQKWQGTPSHAPSYYATIANYMFGFKDNIIGRHNTGEGFNSFYGEQFDSRFKVSANAAPSMVKTAHAMSVEADRGLDITIDTNLNGTFMPTSLFEKKEGFVYGNIPYAKSNSTDNHISVLGQVTEIDGNTTTVKGLNTTLPNVIVGARVYNQNDNFIGEITSIVNKNTVELSQPPTMGDFLLIKFPLSTHGDNIRGYSFILDCKLTDRPDEEFVMHGINIKVNESANSNA